MPSRIVDRGRPGGTGEVQCNPRQLVAGLSTQTRMKCRDRLKSVSDLSLLYAIQRFSILENNHSGLFFIGEWTAKLTESLRILQRRIGETRDRHNNLLRAGSLKLS